MKKIIVLSLVLALPQILLSGDIGRILEVHSNRLGIFMMTTVNHPSREFAFQMSKKDLVSVLVDYHPKWMNQALGTVTDGCDYGTDDGEKRAEFLLNAALKAYRSALGIVKKDPEKPLTLENITDDPETFIRGYNEAADELSALRKKWGEASNQNLTLWRDIQHP